MPNLKHLLDDLEELGVEPRRIRIPGQLYDSMVASIGEAEGIKEFPRPPLALVFSHAVERGAKAEVLIARQLSIEVAFIRNCADQVLARLGIVRAVDTADADCPAVRSGQACQYVYCCGLAGAIGTKKAT